ncbi:DUF669 domain-containing protein [Chloroflexota bacterium]
MSIQLDINLDDIPSEFKNLPHGRYLISLMNVEKLYAKKTNRPYLKWWWKVVDGDDELLGEKLVSCTGIGTKESWPFMNTMLKRQLKALGLECTVDFNIKELLYQRVTLYIDASEDDLYPTIRMAPAEYYENSPTWRPYGWLW